jgi:hypothetical protein
MKKQIIAVAALGVAVSVMAQGTVNFALNGTGLKAPIYGVEAGAGNATVSKTGNTTAGLAPGTQVYTGSLLAGSGFSVALFAATGSGVAESSLTAQATSTFRTGGAAGFVPTPNIVTLTGIAKDAPVATVQLRAWDNTSGNYTTWAQAETAWNAGTIAAGKSQTFNLAAIGGDFNTPPILLGATSFNIYMKVIPEPSTFALLGLGALGMMIFRRK